MLCLRPHRQICVTFLKTWMSFKAFICMCMDMFLLRMLFLQSMLCELPFKHLLNNFIIKRMFKMYLKCFLSVKRSSRWPATGKGLLCTTGVRLIYIACATGYCCFFYFYYCSCYRLGDLAYCRKKAKLSRHLIAVTLNHALMHELVLNLGAAIISFKNNYRSIWECSMNVVARACGNTL